MNAVSLDARPVVLHVSQAVEAGVVYVIESLVRQQRASGWHVIVCCPVDGQLASIAREAGAEVLPWEAERSPGISVLSESWHLARIIRSVAPDLVHLHTAKAGLVGRLVVRGRRPTTFTPHAWSWLAVEGVTRRAALLWERHGSRWADSIVCLSPGEVEEGVDAGIKTSPVLIPNDVPVRRLRASAPATRAQARGALRVDLEAPLVVCCARLVSQKGQSVLLEAWERVRAALPGAQLVLVGDGPDRAELERSAAQMPEVVFAGMLDRAGTLLWMKAATVVACPSHYEGMSLVPLEAATLGVPVVATDVEGMRSLLSPEARTIVPVGDAAALADALLAFLCDEGRVVAGGREAAHHMDVTARMASSAERTMRLYQSLLAAPEGRRLTVSSRS